MSEASTAGTDVEYRAIPCEPGTYNDVISGTDETFCVACPATKACEYKGLWDTTAFPDCAAGYFCKSGAESRYPSGSGTTLSGPCPVGHYCPEQPAG